MGSTEWHYLSGVPRLSKILHKDNGGSQLVDFEYVKSDNSGYDGVHNRSFEARSWANGSIADNGEALTCPRSLYQFEC